jgi:serine/threonine protein kinase
MNGSFRTAISRWWLGPAVARVAFDDATIDAAMGGDTQPAAPLVRIDLLDPTQRDFGDYELIEEIGRGGMGVVYRARQHDLDREVALKLLSAGPWASEALIEVLRNEAQYAGRLQHPNIVVVHAMGERAGLVFYAMQLVPGRSLSQRLDTEGPMPAREAARMLRTVAEAVDYAHRLDVLHLDLKPGNILVEADGTPRIADFGLARGLEQAFDEERVSGTPGYMAPEQARPGRAPLSPATDVWALGAVLYEMLTGYPPFEGDDAEHTLRLLLEGTVRRPSRNAAVPADLEAICLHCLQKDPAQRYQGARALADDLGRFLEGRAVSVRELNLFQRSAHWARREPKVAIAATAAVGVLAIGLATSLWLWRRAEASASETQQINRFLNEDVLAAADPSLEPGEDPAHVSVPALLANAESKLDRDLDLQPAARAQAGLSIARAYFGLGLWHQSYARLTQADADARTRLPADAPLVLQIEQQLGITATYDGRYAEAQRIYADLLPRLRAGPGWTAPETIAARRGYGLLLDERDNFEQAREVYESVQADAAKYAPQQLNQIDWELADLYTELNRWNQAEALMREALARSREQLGPHSLDYLWQTMFLGDLLNMRGRWDEAEALFRQDREELLALVGPLHPKTICAVHYLGQIALERGDTTRAMPLLQEALRERLQVHGDNHKWTQYTMSRVGQAYIALGQPREGIAVLERALDLATREGRRQQAYVLLILDNLARGYMAVGDLDRAEALLDEGLANAKASLPADNIRRGMLERSLGELRERKGLREEAIAHYAYAEHVFTGFRPDHPWVLDLKARIAKLQAGKPASKLAAG